MFQKFAVDLHRMAQLVFLFGCDSFILLGVELRFDPTIRWLNHEGTADKTFSAPGV